MANIVEFKNVSMSFGNTHVLKNIDLEIEKGKFYTVLSLDQGTNTGAIKIRLRTLLAEIEERNSFCKER